MMLVTGAGGQVGSYIDEGIITDKHNLDVTNKRLVDSYVDRDIDCILHLAAETDLERCEKRAFDAYEVNTIGTYNMLNLAMKLDIPFVYISTAGVFDGTKVTPYTEEDEPNPINVYGESKFYGEVVVRTYPKHYIFRSGWMMGGGPTKEKKFVKKIIDKIKLGERELMVINDIYGSPTYAKDLVKTIDSALTMKIPYGTYHACNSGRATRYDVAKEVVRIMKYPVDVIPVSSQKFLSQDKDFPCTRSSNEMMDMSKLYKQLIATRDWKDALKEYMEEWK